MSPMKTFLFRCPTTGYNVQGRAEEHDAGMPSHVGQHCLACGALHVVSPHDGRLLGNESGTPADAGQCAGPATSKRS